MKRILSGAAVLLAAGAVLFLALGAAHGSADPTYRIELDNAFGLVNGADFKVAGVIAGSIKKIELCYADRAAHCQNPLHAVVTVGVTQKGFGAFHADAFCQSRPQSLIGEYFVDCEPGSTGPVLAPGSTIPASHTQSTIPADLVQNIMRLPYRQRFSIIINELGAAVAARSEDLATALRRADPALAETDNLLALLANDAQTIRDLNANANTVITELARNSKQVQDFIVQADKISSDSATQAPAIQATWQKLPAFLEQLRPAMAKLGAAADAQDPVLVNLNEAATNLNTFFHELVPFSYESVPSLQSLGRASAVGKPAVIAARPLVRHLNQFSYHTPELAQNLAIVLHALDDRGYAVEADPRSPDGGRGYTGLEALLQYVFNQTLAIDYFGPYGHLLGVDAFANTVCSPYTTPQTLANDLAQYAAGQSSINPRSCYAWLGPNQPGVNEPDPSFNASLAAAQPGHPNGTNGCVPDPGGYPVFPGYQTNYYGPKTNVCKLQASSTPGAASDQRSARRAAGARAGGPAAAAGGSTGSAGSSGSLLDKVLPPIDLHRTLSQLLSGVAAGVVSKTRLPPAGGIAAAIAGAQPSQSSGLTAAQTQQLLNYLLAP
jgi:ABC-type transporter Mla subunit MlaD